MYLYIFIFMWDFVDVQAHINFVNFRKGIYWKIFDMEEVYYFAVQVIIVFSKMVSVNLGISYHTHVYTEVLIFPITLV